MILINKNHLDRFKYFRNTYNYLVAPGVWLTFDTPGLDFIGINYFYLPRNNKELENKCHETIERLLATDILYVKD